MTLSFIPLSILYKINKIFKIIDINALADWCRSWNLKLNLKNCSALNIGPLTHDWINCSYFVNNDMIPTNPSYKDLGIITPDDLNFSKHSSHFAYI